MVQTYEVAVRDIEYQRQDDRPYLARIYQPKGNGPFPTLVHIHGGAWHQGDRTSDKALNERLAQQGILVVALDYRQPPLVGYPASIADINLGIRWTKQNVGRFNGTERLGCMGISSGGHQALLTALGPHDPRYAALNLPGTTGKDASVAYVVGIWPVSDPVARYRMAVETGNENLMAAHGNYWGTEENMADGSPQVILETRPPAELPPVFMALKHNDSAHPLPMQERFIETYRSRGGAVTVQFVETPGDGTRPGTELTAGWIAEFVRQQHV